MTYSYDRVTYQDEFDALESYLHADPDRASIPEEAMELQNDVGLLMEAVAHEREGTLLHQRLSEDIINALRLLELLYLAG